MVVVVLAGCGTAKPGGMSGPSMGRMSAQPLPPEVVSTDILRRQPLTEHAEVKHILIGYSSKADAYDGRMDPRAKDRSQADAEALVKRLVAEQALDNQALKELLRKNW